MLFLSQHDLPDADARARELLAVVPIVALTRGWRGVTLVTRDGVHDVPSLPRAEKDPTGAGDVFAAAFLVRYQETDDPLEAAAPSRPVRPRASSRASAPRASAIAPRSSAAWSCASDDRRRGNGKK